MNDKVLLALTLVSGLALNGCALLGISDHATYNYSRTSADICTLDVDSGRVLSGGVDVKLTACDVTVTVGKVENGGGNSLGDVIGLATILRSPVVTPPAKE